jgi:hypothetical protein
MKKLITILLLNLFTYISLAQRETELSNYEKYRLQKDIKEHATLYDKILDTIFIDTLYITDTVYLPDKSNKKNQTIVNNYYEDEDYGYDGLNIRFHLYFGHTWYYDPWYSWNYDPWFYDPWYNWNYSYFSYWYFPWYFPRYYYPNNYHGWNGWGYHHNYSRYDNYPVYLDNHRDNIGYPRDSRHEYNVTRPTSITSHATSTTPRVNKTVYVDKDTRNVINTNRSNSINSRTLNTTRPTTTKRDYSPYSRALEENRNTNIRSRTITPNYTKPTTTYIRPSYNSGTSRSSTTYRSSTPTKSTNSYSRPSTSYSTPSRSSSSPSTGSSTYRSTGSSYSGRSSSSSSGNYRSSGSSSGRSSSYGGSSQSHSPRR